MLRPFPYCTIPPSCILPPLPYCILPPFYILPPLPYCIILYHTPPLPCYNLPPLLHHPSPTILHVEYAERGKEYGFLFIFSLFCEHMHLEYVRIHAIYRLTQAEYVICIRMAASQEYVNTYSTRRPTIPPLLCPPPQVYGVSVRADGCHGQVTHTPLSPAITSLPYCTILPLLSLLYCASPGIRSLRSRCWWVPWPSHTHCDPRVTSCRGGTSRLRRRRCYASGGATSRYDPLSVCGRCSFGGLGCCSCRVRVSRCRGCCSLSVCVCV